MSYTQNNPFSRKSSPLNKDDQWIQKATADIKKRGTEGVCTGDKFGSESCPPGSKRYNLAKTFKKMAKNRKGGPSRESSEEKYMPIEDDMHKKGEGDTGMSRQPYGGNKGDEKKSVRDYEGPSRRSSSPFNQDENERSGYSTWDKLKGTAKNIGSYISDVPGKLRQTNLPVLRPTGYDLPKLGNEGEFVASEREEEKARLTQSAKERQARVSEGSAFFRKSSPLNNTGITGLNYSKELQYMPIEDDMHRGMSRQSSSPLDYGSWAHEDATRAKDLYKKGDYAHARALGIDEHDADYGKWRSSEAEHGTSRRSRSERLRDRAKKRSERVGAEWGDYDYEDPRVQKMLSKANELDERSGKEMKMTMTKHIKPLPKKKA
jgi:hypothetical protein